MSLPELDRLGGDALGDDLDTEIGDALASFGEIAAMEMQPEFMHAFTHYRLRVRPLRVQLALRHDLVAQRDYAWLPLAVAADAGLPSPVRKLVEWVLQDAGSRPAPGCQGTGWSA
jgi:A/G-specific adenine glycosylase